MIPETLLRFFRETKADNNGFYCHSYEHIGQHGGADYKGIIAVSAPAISAEYKDLKKELESAPYHYNLKVIKKYSK